MLCPGCGGSFRVRDARFTDTATSCDIFSKLERHKSIHDGIRTADPGLLEIHAMDGQTSRLVVLGLVAHRQHLEQARVPELRVAPVLQEGAVER